jgi:hypothetical protein
MRQQNGNAAEQQHQDTQGLNPMRDTDEQAMTFSGSADSATAMSKLAQSGED